MHKHSMTECLGATFPAQQSSLVPVEQETPRFTPKLLTKAQPSNIRPLALCDAKRTVALSLRERSPTLPKAVIPAAHLHAFR